MIAEDPIPVLITRREGTSAQFVSIIQPYPDGVSPVELLTVTPTDENGVPISPDVVEVVKIDRPAGTDLLILSEESGVKQIESIQFNGTWGWISQLDGELKQFHERDIHFW